MEIIKGKYQGLDESAIHKDVKERGFHPHKIHDGPGYTYEEHTHPETKLLAILKGSMDVQVADKNMTLQKGDLLIIPGNTRHSAVMGDEGCVYFWSERP